MSEQQSDDQQSDRRLVVYADYVCPFCYLGKAAMEQYLDSREEPLNVEWRFYDLRGYKRNEDGSIDHDVDDGKDDEYFEQARKNVERLKDEYDVEMELDVSFDVDSWNAQQVALFVRQELSEESFQQLHDRLFDALWQEGVDVGEPEILRELVTEVDLNPAVVDEALTPKWEERLEERFDAAREAGVTGVPTFVFGDHAARGAIPPEQIERLVEGN